MGSGCRADHALEVSGRLHAGPWAFGDSLLMIYRVRMEHPCHCGVLVVRRLQVLHVLARATEHRGFVCTGQGLMGRRPARQTMVRDLL